MADKHIGRHRLDAPADCFTGLGTVRRRTALELRGSGRPRTPSNADSAGAILSASTCRLFADHFPDDAIRASRNCKFLAAGWAARPSRACWL